ncbi:hypothetical protein D9757_007053 [Collybiopsis confluens]|uniref:Gelsolin-like domain-containing protein n=1 Tax=Collybiopsis confluens TaxID=2823264 RepID=A0A8H5HCC4_9AGAR|nr:hypothetical protein D9757_007053 [Collybiopsis confluens]
MAHLTKPTKYNIEDSNIALLGSDLEKRVREHGGDKESAWQDAGAQPGLQIWRIEKFHVVPWPQAQEGSFYDGDSYILLYTYKKTPESESLSYNIHFWLGEDTSQDEAGIPSVSCTIIIVPNHNLDMLGTAAYKTVELDDHLHGLPIQYREVQAYESERFLSYFPRGFICLNGGISTGFHHVADMPLVNTHKLYRISITTNLHPSKAHSPTQLLAIRQVPFSASSLVEGDVFVLDKGTKVWQLNTKESAGKEKFKAAEFVRSLVETRKGASNVTVFDEGGHGTGTFLSEFGEDATIHREERLPSADESLSAAKLFRISDATGQPTFAAVDPPISRSSLSSNDAFLLDSGSSMHVWIGAQSSLTEQRLALQYAQKYLHDRYNGESGGSRKGVAIPIIKMREGHENEEFLKCLRA